MYVAPLAFLLSPVVVTPAKDVLQIPGVGASVSGRFISSDYGSSSLVATMKIVSRVHTCAGIVHVVTWRARVV